MIDYKRPASSQTVVPYGEKEGKCLRLFQNNNNDPGGIVNEFKSNPRKPGVLGGKMGKCSLKTWL